MMFNAIWPSTSYSSQYFTASYRTIFCDCEISLSSYLTAVASYNYSKVVKGSFDYSFNDNTMKSSCWVHVLTKIQKNVIFKILYSHKILRAIMFGEFWGIVLNFKIFPLELVYQMSRFVITIQQPLSLSFLCTYKQSPGLSVFISNNKCHEVTGCGHVRLAATVDYSS